MFPNIEFPHNRAAKGTNVDSNRYFVNIMRKIIKNIGANVIDPGFEMNPAIILSIAVTLGMSFSFLYMAFTDDSMAAILEAFCITNGVFQGVHKLFSVIIHPEKYEQLFFQIRNLNSNYVDDPVVAPVLKRVSVYCTISFECFAFAFYSLSVGLMTLVLFLWLKYSLITTLLPIHIPFIDWRTTIGYSINTAVHGFCCTIGVTALMSGDVVFLYFVLHSIGYIEIFKSRINKLDKLLIDCHAHDRHTIEEQLFKCIQAHQDYISYIQSVDDIYSSLCLTQLVTAELSLIFSILLTLWTKWVMGPFVAICCLCQILQYCILGTVVTVQNDKASQIIYGFSWYLLPVHYQKLIVLMIMRAQKPAELNVGGFAKLNVATCMQLIKTTYSYVMMLLEFLG